jgi:ribosomal protein L22
VADEKETRKKAADPQAEKPAAEDSQKPRRRRSTAAKKEAGSGEEKPKRTRTTAKAAAEGGAKPKAPARRRAAPKAKAAEPDAAPEPKAEEASEATEEKKAPARRRRAAPRREAPERPRVRPVVTARAKYVRSSARKARLVLDHIRGKEIGEARALLRHSPRGVARDIERLLDSAVANAENNHELVGDDLLVKEIYADEGPTIKRFRPRAQGRAYRIRKRTSHLTVALTPKE